MLIVSCPACTVTTFTIDLTCNYVFYVECLLFKLWVQLRSILIRYHFMYCWYHLWYLAVIGKCLKLMLLHSLRQYTVNKYLKIRQEPHYYRGVCILHSELHLPVHVHPCCNYSINSNQETTHSVYTLLFYLAFSVLYANYH